jgi:hypothetical protein
MTHSPNKVDKDAVHTALAITVLSTIFVELINLGLDEIRAWRESKRPSHPDSEKK